MESGEISQSGAGDAIKNNAITAINITDGIVSAKTGIAIRNEGTGIITISNGAFVSSGNENTNSGTIYLANAAGSGQRLVINGGLTLNFANATAASAIYNASPGNVIISDGAVMAVRGCAVYNASTGTVLVSEGTVNSLSGTAIHNASTGFIDIQGGEVKASSNASSSTAILNASTGTVKISGNSPEVSARAGTAIHNNAGVLLISSGTISSKNTSPTTGTIYLADQSGTSGTRLNITGGEVRNIAPGNTGIAIFNASAEDITISDGKVESATGTALRNNHTGDVDISGGKVESSTGTAIINNHTGNIRITGGDIVVSDGVAIRNVSDGIITISNTATVYSNNSTATEGTIVLESGTSNTNPRLVINGGVVNNHNGSPNAAAVINHSDGEINMSDGGIVTVGGISIKNESTGVVNISGGRPISNQGIAIRSNNAGVINISNSAHIQSANSSATSGSIVLSGSSVLNISGGTVDNYNDTSGLAIYSTSTGTIAITGGTVLSISGVAIYTTQASSAVTVSDGIVRASNALAIDAAGSLAVDGNAVVFAYGSNMNDVINNSAFTAPAGNAIVIAWDNTQGNTDYIIGSTDDLFSNPADVVQWGYVGLEYNNAGNTGAIIIGGITVRSLGTDASLSALTVSAGALTPAFNGTTYNYSVDVDMTIASITLTATPNDAYATVSGDGSHTLNFGANVLTVTVISEDNTSTVTYTVTVNRASTAPGVPSVPQNFTATPGNGQVALTWTDPANLGSSSITAYEVSSDNGDTWITSSSLTGHTFSGLTNDIIYVFRVRAINSLGAGAEAWTTGIPADNISTATSFLNIRAEAGCNIALYPGGYYAQGEVVNIVAVENGNNAFLSWASSGGGVIADPYSPNTTFIMPGNGVTITAKFRSSAREEAWENARSLIQSATFTLTQQEALNEATARVFLSVRINELIRKTGFAITADEVDFSSFNPANAGTVALPLGVDGRFDFNVIPSGVCTYAFNSGTITASPVSNALTSKENNELQAWILNGALHVAGLVPGETWSVYTMNGVLIYTGIAGSESEKVQATFLQNNSVYIVTDGFRTVKVAK